METITKSFVFIAILVSFQFFSSNGTVSPTVDEFCKKRTNGAFCLETFGADARSGTAKDMKTLLKVCIDSAATNAKNTHGILVGLSSAPKDELKPVLTDCISSFDSYVSLLKGVVKEFESDPSTASYDGMLALAELNPCNETLTKSKVTEPQILSNYKAAHEHCLLCVDVANAATK